MTPSDQTQLESQLQRLHLGYVQSNYKTLARKAAEQQRSHLDYLAQLVEGEFTMREMRSIERRIRNARFPVRKTLDDFQWGWPKKINRLQIQNLFRLDFIATCTNVVMIGNVGLGKTHLSIALGHAACTGGHSVLFTTAVDVINTLAAAQSAGQLKREIRRYLKPAVLIVDELGYLPIDKHGADLLFQIISERYERAPIVITTNRDRGALVALADDLEQQVCAVLVDREVAELVDDEDGGLEITADLAFELAGGLGGGKRIDDVNGGGEEHRMSAATGGVAQGDCQMGFAQSN